MGPTGNKLTILTYTLYVKWNILGQEVNVTIPVVLPNPYYFYYKLIS